MFSPATISAITGGNCILWTTVVEVEEPHAVWHTRTGSLPSKLDLAPTLLQSLYLASGTYIYIPAFSLEYMHMDQMCADTCTDTCIPRWRRRQGRGGLDWPKCCCQWQCEQVELNRDQRVPLGNCELSTNATENPEACEHM